MGILNKENRKFKREELKEMLFKSGIGKDIGQTGRYLSGISQFITKKTTPHFRQIISFDSEGGIGDKKDNYHIKEEYTNLLKEVLNELKTDEGV